MARIDRARRAAGVLGFAAVTLLLGGTAAAAQVGPEGPRDPLLPELFGSLTPHAGLRLVTVGGVVEEGLLEVVRPGGIDMLQDGERVEIGYDFMRSVSVEGGHGLQGAIWGAAGGALAGAVFGMMVGSFDCQTTDGCTSAERSGALRWGAVLGGIGGGIGFYFGRRDVHWHPIYP